MAFVDAADAAAVAAAALLDPERHHNRAWTPTGPEAPCTTEITEITENLSDTLGRSLRYIAPGAPR